MKRVSDNIHRIAVERRDQTDTRVVTTRHLAILLANLHRAVVEQTVGFEDADRTSRELEMLLTRRVAIPRHLLESALWCCNLLWEKRKFFHPDDNTSFAAFFREMCPDDRFDLALNLIEKKDR